MKYRIKNTLRSITSEIGIKVKFVHYFDGQTHGKLLPREKRMLINARQPRTEHIFTLFHELGHYFVHFINARRQYHPRVFDLNLRMRWFDYLSKHMKRFYRYRCTRERFKEWEADLWAFCAFIVFAKMTGCRRELKEFLIRHPEKLGTFALAVAAMAYTKVKKIWFKAIKLFSFPFRPCAFHF